MHVNIARFFLLCLMTLAHVGCQKEMFKEKPCKCLEREKDWLYVNFSIEPPTFDFRKTSCRTTAPLSEMLYEGLMKVERDGTIRPAQAERVMISPDGLQYTFDLRDTRWSDGVPVSAQDFASTWLENLDPNFPSVYTHLFYCIKNAKAAKEGLCPLSEVGIRVEGEKKLIVELEQPTAYFLCLTTSAWYFPIRTPKETTKGGHLIEGELVSNGPFMVQKWQAADQIRVVKNPHYHNFRNILLQGIHISLINDENTAAELFEHGDFDLLGMPFSPIPIDRARTLDSKNKIASIPVGGVTVCCFNTKRAPFNHVKLRRAFSLAIDRRQLMDVFYPSVYAPAFSLVPSVFLPAGEHKIVHSRSEEIESARRDFNEGLLDLGVDLDHFPVIELNYTQNKGNTLIQRLAEVMQQDWQDVLGVKVVLQGLEVQSLIQRMTAKNYDTSLISWTANYQDPMCFFDKFLSASNKNYPGWTDPAYNEAIEKANASLDIKIRAEFLWEAEEIFRREAPCAPLFHWSFPMVAHSRVQGLYVSPAASLDFTTLKVHSHEKNEH